ncbi:MAG TPA: alpha/beta hydrolase domain-containing protein, partial [Inquilinus sp.]|nr:alpha/beta hydrolase domain-containing protein [Inquilinus sp.]
MRLAHTEYIGVLLFVALAVGATLAAPPSAQAEIKSVTVLAATDIGPFRGKVYRELETRMEGSAPGGPYTVPVTIAFPKQVSDHNGFAVVDIVNTVTIGNSQFVVGGRPLPLARMHMGEDFLFGMGNAYVAVIWDKMATDLLGNGTIAIPVDAYSILRDAAAFARNPAAFLPAEAGTPPASSRLVAYGYSQTGSILRGWYAQHLNSQTGVPTFDGALVAAASG